ncbi:golgin candidate 2-like isoform X1 [Nicotiana tabacum]|uniref:Golgin candidate 2-like n=2 Tax=Nicotiana TaxID=4085 RepID=A0A1S4BLF4_TOBAC|nr:PREDICTED: golgin candidate 2 isoform X1 [Nicotiana sylvestris]XP_016489699.1 PREDICTED: golgin candidate 2-like [Nicotiana tabacum]
MAHWISSKLKVAENLLQQIDQQAAGSLRKSEKQRSDDLDRENIAKTNENKPLKDQLKKKSLETDDLITKSRTDRNSTSISLDKNNSFRSNSNYKPQKEAVTPIDSSPKSSTNALTDTDWTELLSAPSSNATAGASNGSNGVAGIRSGRSDGRKQRSLGSGSNLLAVEGKRSQKPQKVVKSVKGSNSQSENEVDGSRLERRANNAGYRMPVTSSVNLKIDGGEGLDRRDLHRKGENVESLRGNKDEQNEVKNEYLEDFKGVKKSPVNSRSGDKSLGIVMGSATLDKELDIKNQLDDNKSIRPAKAMVDRPKMDSQISTSVKMGSSSPSNGESDSETDSASSSDSESEREREERRRRRQQILAEKAAAKAMEAIKERENMVAKLEGEKQSLEKILEQRAKQQVEEASELQTKMMETMEAVELEKQKHNSTRMETLTRLAKLETVNAELARYLASVQWNLEVEINQVAELRQQVESKEAVHEELRREISGTQGSGEKLVASKGVEVEREILEAEHSFLTDKLGLLQEKAKTLERSIETTQHELENPTAVEIELKRRLGQLTDHLIQKQAQVEALSSEKATMTFKIEAVSRSLEENKSMLTDFPSTSSMGDLESGLWELSNSKLRPLFEERMRSGQQHLGSLIRQLDSIFCAGMVFLRRNPPAKLLSLVYLVSLHLWVIYILMSHAPVSEDSTGAVISLENINKTGGM